MKTRKARCKLKGIIRKSTPKSSRLYSLAADYKFWYVRYLNRSDCFFSKFANLNIVTTKKLLGKSKQTNNPFLANHKTTKSTSQIERFCVKRMKVLTSGDIELNPGPQQGVNSETTLSVGSTMLLSFRLRQLGWRPQDVGGAGDCFFRAVSHQLYGDPSYHWYIRQAGIHYLRENPERFIESNTQNSWNEYLTNMSLQGSWCDAVIVQAVAESQNVRIHIGESHETSADKVHLSQSSFITTATVSATLYLGHLNEVHYVSTVPYTCSFNSLESQHSDNQLSITEQNFFSEKSNNSPKRKSDSNMNEHSKKKMSHENSCGLECEAEKQSSSAYRSQNFENKTDKICVKRNHNAYMREYKEKKHIADETSAKTKHNAYMRKYREKKKVDESRKGKSNNPSLERGIEMQSSTSNNDQNTECDIEKQSDGSMVEYKKAKIADKISAKTKRNAYMREYRKKRRLMKLGGKNLMKTILVLNVGLKNKVLPLSKIRMLSVKMN